MTEHQSDPASTALRAARSSRDELHQALVDLEQAVAAAGPARAKDWATSVGDAVARVEASFARHVHVTEAPDGLYGEILTLAPRLAQAVQRLRDDHRTIDAELEQLAVAIDAGPGDDTAAWIDARREQCMTVLGRLTRHRQRGADLTYEAYSDVGGDG